MLARARPGAVIANRVQGCYTTRHDARPDPIQIYHAMNGPRLIENPWAPLDVLRPHLPLNVLDGAEGTLFASAASLFRRLWP
jgi:hypothetical protein